MATNSAIESKNELSRYYNQQFLNAYNTQNIKSIDPQALFNKLAPLSLDFQAKYIASNQYPLGEKDTLDALRDGTQYDDLHQRYHPSIRTFLKEFGYYDVFIVEPDTGYVVYSVFKEVDFATSLKNGPYSQSGLATAYNGAM